VAGENARGAGEVKSNICYKCGIALTKINRTREHIPPKCFVRKENSGKLIIVPSCKVCNEGRSLYDEHFKNWITTAIGSRNQEAKFIYENKTKKSWEYRPNIRYGLKNSRRKIDVLTPAGLYLGRQTYLYLDEKKGLPVIDSIAKGILWFNFNKSGLKMPYNIEPQIIEDPNPAEQFINEIYTRSRLVNLIENVFQYRYLLIDYPNEGWIYCVFIRFYNEKVFLVSYTLENQ
jgi:hypothetical protein